MTHRSTPPCPSPSCTHQSWGLSSLPVQEGKSLWSISGLANTGPTTPGPPAGLSVKDVNRDSGTVSWRCPLDTGGGAIMAYQVRASSNTSTPAWLRCVRCGQHSTLSCLGQTNPIPEPLFDLTGAHAVSVGDCNMNESPALRCHGLAHADLISETCLTPAVVMQLYDTGPEKVQVVDCESMPQTANHTVHCRQHIWPQRKLLCHPVRCPPPLRPSCSPTAGQPLRAWVPRRCAYTRAMQWHAHCGF